MLATEPYSEQVKAWPDAGRHILAQFDNDSIVVYQAYRPAIGLFAAEHGTFGGDCQLLSNELDQTQFPVDDVPLRLGNERRAGGHPGTQAEKVFFDSL